MGYGRPCWPNIVGLCWSMNDFVGQWKARKTMHVGACLGSGRGVYRKCSFGKVMQKCEKKKCALSGEKCVNRRR